MHVIDASEADEADRFLKSHHGKIHFNLWETNRLSLERAGVGQIEGDAARFTMADAASPTLIRDVADASAMYVLMPMRV